MRLGLATIAGVDRPLVEVMDAARAADLEFIELSERGDHAATPSERVSELASERGLGVDVLGSYVGFAGPIHDREVDAAIARARAVGAALVRVWAADAAGSGVGPALRRAAERASDAGLALTLERHVGGRAESADDVERLLDAVGHPSLGLCWQPLDEPDDAFVAGFVDDASRLLPRSNHIHAKNYVAGEGRPRELGGALRGGLLDWGPVLPLIAAYAPEARVAIEFVETASGGLQERILAAANDLRALRGRA